MRYRLLGQLVIGDPDRPVALGGPWQTRILAALLLRPHQAVAVALRGARKAPRQIPQECPIQIGRLGGTNGGRQ